MPERGGGKGWHPEAAAAARAKRDPPLPLLYSAIHLKIFHDPDAGGEAARTPHWRRGVVGAAAGFDGGSGGESDDWEEDLRNRLKELEEMKELERTAEELQSRVVEEGTSEEEETEEEKRNRVRRELERVAKEQAERRQTAKAN